MLTRGAQTSAGPCRPLWPWLHEVALQLVVTLAVIVATLLGYNLRLTQQVAADQQLPSDELRRALIGFQSLEQSEGYAFLWTEGHAQICLSQFGRASRSIVRLVLLGKGAYALGHTEARLLVNEQPLATLPIVPATRRYDLLLGDQLARQDDHCFQITSSATTLASHTRPLGVPFASFKLLPVGTALTMPAQHQMLLNVLLALVSCWMLRALSVPRWPTGGLIIGVAALLIGLVGVGRQSVGVGVDRLMPPLIGSLAVAAVGAFAVRCAGWLGLVDGNSRQVLYHEAPEGHEGRTISDEAPCPPRTAAHPDRVFQRAGLAGSDDRWYRRLLVRDLLGIAFWVLLLWGGTRGLQFSSGHTGSVWPLKARLNPVSAALVVLPISLFTIWLALVLRHLWVAAYSAGDVSRLRAVMLPLALVLVGAIILPVALKGTLRGWDSLYGTFRNNPYDYQDDVPRVSDPLTLLREYVALAPSLSQHNSTHPPGSLLLLWSLVQVFGPGAVATSWAAIMLSSLGVLAAFWLGWRLAGPVIALLAGALFLIMPGHQIYSVTSMDAVFTALLALGAVSFLLALEPSGRPWLALLSGALIALALAFTYTATQLGFFGVAVFGLAVARSYQQHGGGGRGLARATGHPLRQALLSAGTIVLIYALLWLVTGFDVVASIRVASANSSAAMYGIDTSRLALPFLPPSLTSYVDYLSANIAPYAWYLTPWGLMALSSVLLARLQPGRRLGMLDSLIFGLAGVVLAMWLSGLFIREVERIWAFTYPLAAVVIAVHLWQGPTARSRLWRTGLFMALFITQSVLMRVLLYTYW